MTEKITWTAAVQVAKGPKFSDSRTLEVEAYDHLEVNIPGGDNADPGEATVEVQPGGAGQVLFLMVSSSLYDEALTYTVDGGAAENSLDGLHLLIGKGAVKLLGDTQNTFSFVNKAGANKPATIQILVGRKATTP